MSKLTKAEIEHLANLSELTLSPEEKEKIGSELSLVIDYFTELQEIDTEGVEPTSQTTGLTDVLRDDRLREKDNLTSDEATSGSDTLHGNAFVVPQILDKSQ